MIDGDSAPPHPTAEICRVEKAITAFPATTRNKDDVLSRGKKCRTRRDAQ